jgi:cell division septation protein DedD
MAKDYAKFSGSHVEKSSAIRQVVIFFSVAIILGATSLGGFFLVQKGLHRPSTNSQAWANTVTKLKAIFSHPKMVTALSKDELAQEKDPVADNEIHYEFYDALPKVHIAATTQTPAEVLIAEKAKTSTKDEVVAKMSGDSNSVPASAPIFSTDKLSAMIAAETPIHGRYIIQLGEFDSKEAAKQYLQAVTSVGLKADMVLGAGQHGEVYRLQIGPYADKSQAKLSQQQFQKRGITTTILNVPAHA